VQRVWSLASDGRWYSLEELAKQLVLSVVQVRMVLDFLVKYGFAEWKDELETEFRIKADAPSPCEIAKVLRYFARERRLYEGSAA